ncbi:MAG: hypothetical protein ABIV04_00930 [Massilia sp.]
MNIDNALSLLNLSLLEPAAHRAQIVEALNVLMVDIRNVRRKARGERARACDELLVTIQATRPRRYFWQREAPMVIRKTDLLDIYGKGRGLVRSLENDMQDQQWGGK